MPPRHVSSVLAKCMKGVVLLALVLLTPSAPADRVESMTRKPAVRRNASITLPGGVNSRAAFDAVIAKARRLSSDNTARELLALQARLDALQFPKAAPAHRNPEGQTSAYAFQTSKSNAEISDVRIAIDKKLALVKKVKDEARQLQDLLEKMAEVDDGSGFSKFVAGLFGDDSGAAASGSALRAMQQAQREIAGALAEIKAKQQGIDAMLGELQGSQSDLARRQAAERARADAPLRLPTPTPRPSTVRSK